MTAPDGPHPTLAAGERFPLSQRERGFHRFSPSKQNPSPPAGERGQGERGAAGVHGVAEIGFTAQNGTRLAHLYQHDPLRVLFPTAEPEEPPVAVLVTTSGGLVAGDRLSVTIDLGAGASAYVTASAAEKIYRSTGATTEIAQSLSLGDGAWLEYLPPETILFEGARLRRRTALDLAADAGFLGGGILVFGRRARGEAFTRGFLHESWEIGRNGKLAWGDALHLQGDIAAIMADPACFAGAAACATLILVPPGRDCRPFVDAARAVQQQSPAAGLRAGVTAVNGILIARWLGDDAAALRRAYGDLACHLRGAAMGLPARLPRLWHV